MIVIKKIIFSDNIEDEISATIEQYYNMTEEQRQFIYSLLKYKDIEWTKADLIKALFIFNKSKDLGMNFNIDDSNQIFDYIDKESQKLINNLIIMFDRLYIIKNS